MKLLRLSLWISSLVTAPILFAEQQVQTNGFVSIGYLSPSENQFFGDENGDTAVLTENGIRVSMPFQNGWAFSGQMIYREAGDNYDGGVSIDFLQLDYRANWWGEGQQTATIGRFKSQQGLYNKTRDVPQTRPSILLPQSVYLDIARNFFLTLDGAKLNSNYPFEEGDLSVEIAIGKNRFDDKFSAMALGETAEGDWNSFTNHYLDIRYESQNWTAATTFAWVGLSYEPNPNAYLPIRFNNMLINLPTVYGEFESVMSTYSLQYTVMPFELSYEYNDRDFESFGFSAGSTPSKTTMGGQYLQLRYFIERDLIVLARFDEFYINEDDKDGDEIVAGGNSRGYARSIDRTLGLTWRPAVDWQIAIEHHWINGGAWLPPIGKNAALPILDDDWELSAVQVSYQF